jgi:ABC-type multidrug transport system ATPase subunit
MRLFALVAQTHQIEKADIAKKIVEQYLLLNIRNDKVRQFQIMYDFYYNNLREREIKTGEKQLSLLSVKSIIICDQINEHLTRKQKIQVLGYLLEIVSLVENFNEEDIDFVRTISVAFRIPDDIFYDILAFITNRFSLAKNKDRVLEINSLGNSSKGFKVIYREFVEGSLLFMFIDEYKVCFFKNIEKDNQLYLNDINVELGKLYFFEQGSVIKSPLIGSVFYMDIIKAFLHDQKDVPLRFVADNISYTFSKSEDGIKPFNLIEESGHLIGIIGGSGVGKSTMLNLLNGSLKPRTGNICINGYNIHEEKDRVSGLIGYIPQDDILIEELSVFQNLYFNARLCFKRLSKQEIVVWVIRLLKSLNLYEIRNLQVGSILNKLISGGQRKRLNIALELIREPQILFIDEPTSGLSSTDSENVMELLKLQSLKGKLVFVNIHQPSSDIFKKFDKIIVMDKGGRIVFQGSPLDSVIFVKSYQQLVNAEEGECPTCGNLNPEQLLQILEMKKVDEVGDYMPDRLISPNDWYKNYSKNVKPQINQASKIKLDLPENEFKIPGKFTQFKVFSIRNILAKLADRQYILINALEAPLLGFILSWFTRFNIGTENNSHHYIFYDNINLPVYIFISIVVALFLGLMVSAQEIIRDRKILKRETFLHLNRFSYYSSKIVFLAFVLGFQTLLYVLVGNSIFKIKGMLLPYWLILWSTSMVSGFLGLNLSASIRSVISIYILIPIILIPQILFGGALIQFDKMNSRLSHHEYVPVLGNIMPSRWAYEALAVYQFKNNKFEKQLYPFEMHVSNASFMLNYYIPQLYSLLTDIKGQISKVQIKDYSINMNIRLLSDGLNLLEKNAQHCSMSIESLDVNSFNISTFNEIERYLDCTREYYIVLLNKSITDRDNKYTQFEEEIGGRQALIDCKNSFTNESLSKIVLNKSEPEKIVLSSNKIIRKADPIYYLPSNMFGRSHMYSPVKRLGAFYIDTFYFNLIVLFFMQLLFCLTLMTELFIKIERSINRFRGRR